MCIRLIVLQCFIAGREIDWSAVGIELGVYEEVREIGGYRFRCQYCSHYFRFAIFDHENIMIALNNFPKWPDDIRGNEAECFAGWNQTAFSAWGHTLRFFEHSLCSFVQHGLHWLPYGASRKLFKGCLK